MSDIFHRIESKRLDNIFVFGLGMLGQVLFSFRMIIQWFLSEEQRKVVSPDIFWIFSILGAIVFYTYGIIREDLSIVLAQFITYWVYLGNLKLKGLWKKVPLLGKLFLLGLPIFALVYTINATKGAGIDFTRDLPLWLISLGIFGQILFTLRFLIQYWYSERIGESVLPPIFWWMSLIGSLFIILYGVLLPDMVLIIGHGLGSIVYFRNLVIGARAKQATE